MKHYLHTFIGWCYGELRPAGGRSLLQELRWSVMRTMRLPVHAFMLPSCCVMLCRPLPPPTIAATLPSVLLPGVVACTLPAFYERHREPVVVASKLLCVVSYPIFRLSWHAPGAPLDVRAAFGSFFRLPVHPVAALQCGAVPMMGLSIRHSLRFKAQLLCQLAMLVVAMQAEAVSAWD